MWCIVLSKRTKKYISMLDHKEPGNDRKFRERIVLLTILFLGGVLIANLYRLQINDAEKYILMSDKNRIRVSPTLPRRGRIITADGQIVANCISKYRLMMDRCSDAVFQKNISIISKSVELSDADKTRIENLRKKFAPVILIKDDLSWDEYSKLSMDLFKLSHVSIESNYARNYSMPLEFCHVTGHIARSSGNIPLLIGKTGVEYSCDGELVGEIGNVQTEVNSVGKKVRIIDSQEPKDGRDVVISIDSQLQKYVYDVMSRETAGACVVLDISNGEVLAMVSVPAFDPNIVSRRMTKSQWEAIINDPLTPLMDRIIGGTYPPGSVFKIVVAFAALSEKIISPNDKILCLGGTKVDNHTFHCWNRRGHGRMNLQDALKYSCDCYFYEIAKKLGIDNIVKYAGQFGFGKETEIELFHESSGLLPTKQWKFLRYRTSWKPYETVIAGIGQGALLSTLMQTAVMMGKLYSENYDFTPTLLKGANRNQTKKAINHELAAIIKEALYQVCASGTASGSCRADYGISGKTGSSQVRRIKETEAGKDQKLFQWKLRDHAFFVGCAPYKNPKYVVAIFVEHGGGGAATAAPLARKIFDRLIKNESSSVPK